MHFSNTILIFLYLKLFNVKVIYLVFFFFKIEFFFNLNSPVRITDELTVYRYKLKYFLTSVSRTPKTTALDIIKGPASKIKITLLELHNCNFCWWSFIFFLPKV